MISKLRKLIAHPKFYLMKGLARFELARRLVPWFVRMRRQPEAARSDATLFADADVKSIATDLKRNGIAQGLRLPRDVVSDIHRYAQTHLCYGNRDPESGFLHSELKKAESIAGRRFATAGYFNTADCDAIRRLAEDPALWSIAETYLGVPPRYLGNNLWWSFPGERSLEEQRLSAQLFHYDLDDFKFLKFFFYITDVDEHAGPHVFVSGSHRRKRFSWRLKVRRMTDGEVTGYYGSSNVLVLNGPSGTGFAEDTFGIHKGASPTKRARLILQLQFGVFDYGIQRDDRDVKRLKKVA